MRPGRETPSDRENEKGALTMKNDALKADVMKNCMNVVLPMIDG